MPLVELFFWRCNWLKERRYRSSWVVFLVVLSCATMAWVEVQLQPSYPAKSALKWLIFGGCMGLYALLCPERRPFQGLQRPDRASLRWAFVLFFGVLTFLLGGYLILSPWLDLSAIPGNLAAKEGISPSTFPLVALYITLGNSLLEELFFRGFVFLELKALGRDSLAWVFSALVFALYHVFLMDGWFHPFFFLLFTAGLAVGGLIFNWLDRRGSLWPSWLVHMGANLATNLIGLHLFDII